MRIKVAQASCLRLTGWASHSSGNQFGNSTCKRVKPPRPATVLALLLLVVLFALPAAAAERRLSRTEAERVYQQGHSAYQKQDYQGAYDAYRQVVDSGFESGDIFYNMGNAAARLNKTGEAVLHYTRARELRPRDPDIRFNLRKIEPAQNKRNTFVLLVPLVSVWKAFSLREWLAAFFTVFVLLGIVGAAFFLRRRGSGKSVLKTALLLMSGLSLVIGAFAGASYLRQQFVSYAVVMPGEASVFSGPGEGFTRLATVPEGTRVRRMSFKDPAWARVHLNDGHEGFVPAEKLKTI